MSSLTRQQLEAWVKGIKIPAMSKVLDVGGSQKPVKDRLGEKGETSTYTILDLAEPHEVSQRPHIVCDLNYERTDAIITKFDYAFCLEVAEYWWNPLQALRNINSFLKPHAKLYLSVPFVYPVHNPKDEDCLRYTETGIVKLLERAGFGINKIIPRTADSLLLESFYIIEGMKPSKDYKSHNAVGWLIEAVKI